MARRVPMQRRSLDGTNLILVCPVCIPSSRFDSSGTLETSRPELNTSASDGGDFVLGRSNCQD